ncbi:MAG: tetratricopeptide repeat protein [Mariniblastus sp.]|nr:tetratricopeptide repeat protein [Mariniblastus sp.]
MITSIERVRRKQAIQTAEGYLELAMVFDDCWPLDLPHRQKLAELTIACLATIRKPQGHKPYILFLKGQAARLAERYKKAVAFLEQSARLDPDNIHALLALGWCYKRINRTDLAIEALETAVEVDNDSAIAHYNLACYWSLTNRPRVAVLHLSNALALNPDYRKLLATETDFDPIRDDVAFVELTSVIV